MLKTEYTEHPNPLYHYGNRFSQMSHTRIRVKFSNLNFHLYNYNLVTSPNCKHCNLPETPNHYFFICNLYSVERNEMMQKITRILQTHRIKNRITLDLILHGSKKLSYTLNTQLFTLFLENLVVTHKIWYLCMILLHDANLVFIAII